MEVETNWIKNEATVRDENRRGVVSIEGMKFVDEDDLKNQIIAIYRRDEINMIEEERK